MDLDQPVQFIFLNQFDVITNYATIEHFNNQYQVFKNVHDMSKESGIIMHAFPLNGSWIGHCRYYYAQKFLRELANVLDYQMIHYKILNRFEYETAKNLIDICYRKRKSSNFISEEAFKKIDGLTDTGNLQRTGN